MQRQFLLVFGHGVLIASSHTHRGRSIVCALLAVSPGVDNLLNLFQLNFNCYWGPSTLELHCLGRGAEAISSGASNSEQHRMPARKGPLFRSARSNASSSYPPKSPWQLKPRWLGNSSKDCSLSSAHPDEALSRGSGLDLYPRGSFLSLRSSRNVRFE